MAKEQARVSLQADRKRPTREAKAAADAQTISLSGTTKSNFRIGGASVDVVLSGTGLSDPGLETAAFLVKKGKDSYGEPDQAGWVVIITPDREGILDDEFPISVKVVQAPPGTYYFAVGGYQMAGKLPKPQFFEKAVLQTVEIEFYVTSPKL